MKKILKVVYCISITVILVWLLRPIVFWLLGLVFVNNEFYLDYLFSWRFILPIAICLTLTGEFLNGKEPSNLTNSILIRIGLSVVAVTLVYLSIFTTMCSWNEKEVFYTNKSDSGKIVLMEYDCGAYDSDINSTQEIRVITPLNKYLNWSSECDTSKIKLDEWESF